MPDLYLEYKLLEIFEEKIDRHVLSISFLKLDKIINIKIYVLDIYLYTHELKRNLENTFVDLKVFIEIVPINMQDFENYNYNPLECFLFERAI